MAGKEHPTNASSASPSTDLSAPSRQSRIDEAYSKWRSNS